MRINGKVSFIASVILIIGVLLSSCVTKKVVNQSPNAPFNIYPAQSELVYENYFYSKWTISDDPEGDDVTYRINYADSIEGLDDPEFYETVETWFLFPNLEEGVWYWRVTSIDVHGNSTRGPIWTFTVNGEELPQPVDIAEIPPDPAVLITRVQNTSFSLEWPEYEDRQNPGNQIVYEIKLYDSKNTSSSTAMSRENQYLTRFAPATTVYTTDTTFTFNNLDSNTLYDWIIIALKNASQTSVIGNARVRTGNNPPSVAQPLNPTDNATDVATDVTLSWTASVDPDGDEVRYFVFMDTVNHTNRIISGAGGIEATQYNPSGLEHGRTYYWFVLSMDSGGGATLSNIQTFSTTAEGMDIPHTPQPTDNGSGIDAVNSPLLQWEHDKKGQEVAYSVYMSDNPKFMALVASSLTDREYQLTGLLKGNTKYYWQVEALETLSGKTTLSESWIFRTVEVSPPVQLSAITNSEGTQIELAYDRAMSDPAGQKDRYTVKRTSVDLTSRMASNRDISIGSIEIKPGTIDTYLLTLEEVLAHGEEIFIDYAPGTIQSSDGGRLEAYEDVPVINRVPGPAPFVEAATATEAQIVVKFDRDMQIPVNTQTQFSIQAGASIRQIDTVTRTASDTYAITLVAGQEIAYGDTVLLSYTKGTVEAQNGSWLESFSGIAVVNDVPPTNPQFVSAETDEDGVRVKVTFDREMSDPTGKGDQFTVDVQGAGIISRQSRVPFQISEATLNADDANIIELMLENAINNGQTVTLDYTAGDVRSMEGATLGSFMGQPVSNNVPAVIPVCTAATLTSDGRHVELSFSREMNAPSREEANQFGILVNGYVNEIESATLSVDLRVMTLELNKIIGRDNAVHVSYTRGTVSSINGGLLESFQNRQVNTDDATLIWVAQDVSWHYSTIQDAIDADTTVDGNTIMVATGTYRENVNFNGKAVVLKSTWETDAQAIALTVIDGENNGLPVISLGSVNAPHEERQSAMIPVIEGFTIRNGSRSQSPDSGRDVSTPIGGIYVSEEVEIRYNIITDNGSETTGRQGCGIYINGVPAHIHHNIIENNYNQNMGAGIYVGAGAPVSERDSSLNYPGVYANTIRNNKGLLGAGVYVAENVMPLNGDGDTWERFNVPVASITFVEHNSNSSNNNVYSGNIITGSLLSSRIVADEGQDIYFGGTGTSSLSCFTLHPATDTGIVVDKTVFSLLCSVAGSTSEGSLTVRFPSDIIISTGASLTIDGLRRNLLAGEIVDSGHSILLQDLTVSGTRNILFDFRLSDELKSGDYGFTAVVDFDGESAGYSPSSYYEATLTIPPLYASPTVSITSPTGGMEFATTTVSFTWEATPGTQTNQSVSREVYGVEKYNFYLAEIGQPYGSGEDVGTAKIVTKTDLAYGRDYKWKVKATGNNGKTTYTTPDATFITRYTLRETGDEGVDISDTWSVDTEAWNEYIVTINTTNLPARFTGETNLMITVSGVPYFFEPSQFDSTVYLAKIPYERRMVREGSTRVPSEDDVKDSFFEITPFVKFEQGSHSEYLTTIKEAIMAIDGSDEATISLYRDLYREDEELALSNVTAPILIRGMSGIDVVIDGEDAHGLFRVDSSATVTFRNLIFKNGWYPFGGALEIVDTDSIVSGCVFEGNRAEEGGALKLRSTSSGIRSVITESTFRENTALDGANRDLINGGAISALNVEVTISDCVFASNTSLRGGAVSVENTSGSELTLNISDSDFNGNSATDTGGLSQNSFGGGLFAENMITELIDSDFASNASDNNGGGLYLVPSAGGKIEGCLVKYNTSNANGGGLYIKNDADFEIAGVKLDYNAAGTELADKGGGIFKTGTGDLTVNSLAWNARGTTPGDLGASFIVSDINGSITMPYTNDSTINVRYNTAGDSNSSQMSYSK